MNLDDLVERCTFPPVGSPLTCAVSGGPDSVALLVLASHAGCDVTAIHVDHGLRAGSAAEADIVAEAASRVGAAFRSERVVVEPGPNLEARARAARRAVLGGAATGHTSDDQAETVLGNLLRGTGPDGLAAMRAGPHHPILALRRVETHAVCASLDLRTVTDPSNLDPRHRRNRLRHEVLPLLADVAGRDPVPLLVRAAEHSRSAADELAAQASMIDPTDAAALAAASPELARRAIREWLRAPSPERHPPDAAAVDRVLAVARGEVVATEIGGGIRVARTGGRLRVDLPPARPTSRPGPGPTNGPDRGLRPSG